MVTLTVSLYSWLMEKGSRTETPASETSRELRVSVPADTQFVEIVGTYGVPEFTIVALLLAASIAGLIAITMLGRFSGCSRI